MTTLDDLKSKATASPTGHAEHTSGIWTVAAKVDEHGSWTFTINDLVHDAEDTEKCLAAIDDIFTRSSVRTKLITEYPPPLTEPKKDELRTRLVRYIDNGCYERHYLHNAGIGEAITGLGQEGRLWFDAIKAIQALPHDARKKMVRS